MALSVNRKFGALELVFTIALIAIVAFGLAYNFLLRAPEPVQMGDDLVVSPSMEVMALYQRVLREPDPAKPGTQLFLNRILAGNEWIHDAKNSPEPLKLSPEGKLYWSCRVSRNAMDRFDLRKDALPLHEYPKGQYQIAILLYRDYQPGSDQEPITYYTGVINPSGAPIGPEKDQDGDGKQNPPRRASDLPDPESDYRERRFPKK